MFERERECKQGSSSVLSPAPADNYPPVSFTLLFLCFFDSPAQIKAFPPAVPEEAPRMPHELPPLWALVPGYQLYDAAHLPTHTPRRCPPPPPTAPSSVSLNHPPLRLNMLLSPLPSCDGVFAAPASASRCYWEWPLQHRPVLYDSNPFDSEDLIEC